MNKSYADTHPSLGFEAFVAHDIETSSSLVATTSCRRNPAAILAVPSMTPTSHLALLPALRPALRSGLRSGLGSAAPQLRPMGPAQVQALCTLSRPRGITPTPPLRSHTHARIHIRPRSPQQQPWVSASAPACASSQANVAVRSFSSTPYACHDSGSATSSEQANASAESKEAAGLALEPKLQLTFTCTVSGCGHRSTHEFTRRSYQKGIVLVQCPGCKNRYVLIFWHLSCWVMLPPPRRLPRRVPTIRSGWPWVLNFVFVR